MRVLPSVVPRVCGDQMEWAEAKIRRGERVWIDLRVLELEKMTVVCPI